VTSDLPTRWAWADIELDAVRHNVEVLRSIVAPSDVWAVVKANGYGHGAIDVARAARAGGADGLCVAFVHEGVELRGAGIDAPILILSEQPIDAAAEIIEHRLTPTVYRVESIEALSSAAVDADVFGYPVHLKVDTGMQRVGAPAGAARSLAEAIRAASPSLQLQGIFTHLAMADEPDDDFTDLQLVRFDDTLAALTDPSGSSSEGTELPLVHVANSAGALAHPATRRSFVRAGIAIYGISPGRGVDHLCSALRPALSLRARVSFVKRVRAGSRISYGLRHTFERDTVVATVPIGYADGVSRRLSTTGGEVLIGGRRRPIVGVVTMDQLMVDCGPDSDVAIGAEVVLIGEQDSPDGPQRIRAEDWAGRLDTIGYEVVCGIGPRVPRRTGPNIDF